MVYEARMSVYRKKLSLFEAEEKEYETNKAHEVKLMALYDEHRYKENNLENIIDTSS